MRYLLDSNAWITHFRKSSLDLSRRLGQHAIQDIVSCSIVLGELQFGVERSAMAQRAANQALVDDVRIHHQSIPFDDAAAIEYAKIRADLTARGLLIGGIDMLIAAIARSNGLTLVTHNTTEFSRVPGLLVENWQIP